MEIIDPNFKIFLKKAADYCVYQDRTQAMVRKRLQEWDITGDTAEEIIYQLVIDNFINEERFAKIFTRGKFHHLHWGRNKIRFELKKHGLSEFCINMGLKELDTDEYQSKIQYLLTKKLGEDFTNALFNDKAKAANYVIGKGFEAEKVWKKLKES